jgi:cobalamin biosynthesis Co2+ chelatase CbiK
VSLIPRYKINTLWGWFGFVQDNENGKFCEYRDYIKLKAEYERLQKSYAFQTVIPGDVYAKLKVENERLQSEVSRLNMEESKLLTFTETLEGEIDQLKKENERLRKDLDYVLDDWGCFKVGHSGGSGIDSVFKAWLYAKGVQS